MGVKSQGRGTAAALGLFLLFAGLVGGGVLYVVAQRRPAQSVEGFARAPVGCTTTLDFTETGTFYVYEEVGSAAGIAGGDCQPVADPSASFEAVFTGDLAPSDVTADDSISYDVDGFDGRSIQRVEITETGQYSVAVTGNDLTVVAALGRDPDDGVDGLTRAASVVAIAGVVLGLLLLVLSGRRSKRAATVAPPAGPGWPSSATDGDSADAPWPPEAPRLDQVPVNPHAPDVTPQPDPAPVVPPAPWQPPSGRAADALPPPDPAPGAPTLPDRDGRQPGS
ncbi:hypothetical protein [Ilumatobacter sp.]|uniref:hypothetical protein n=1 Tax=Ilumatobacter sp. TaxID=1967498 RepID=UPI003AF8B440